MNSPLYTRTEPVLLPFFPKLFYQALREQGFEDEQIFEGMDFGLAQLGNESFRLSIEQHEHFILHMLALTDDPHLALRLVELRNSYASNLPMLAATHSSEIAKALRAIARYNKLITRVFSIALREDVEPPRMDIDVHVEHDLVAYFAVSSMALFLTRFFRETLDGDSLVLHLELSAAEPDGFDEVRAQFPFEVLFGQQDSCIVLDSRHLERPMLQADANTARLVTEMAEQQLREAEAETSLEGAVKLLLVEEIAAPPRLDEAAQMLGLSPRGLRRKLAAAGTSYQGILDGVRLAMAKRMIRETDAPIASIAYQLGFSQPSDFGRAFKKWSGQPPMAYRRQG